MPFSPTRNPGVESAWTANSAVIVENAVPIRIERPSRARAPATLSSSEASDVSAAAPPTRPEVLVRRQHRGLGADQCHQDDGRDRDDERNRRRRAESGTLHRDIGSVRRKLRSGGTKWS